MAHVLASELRKAVVQSAIEGKLTNRLLTDSLIYDNITKIEKEIEILKKQKKWKNIRIIKNEKLPFVIPEEWAWVKLGDIMRIESGDGLISNKMTGSGYPVYGGNGINGYHDAYNISESHIVIGRVGAKCGCVHVTEEYAWVTDNAFIVTYPKKSINKGYLVLCLKAFNLGTRSNSTAQPVVSGQKLYPINLPLPPIEEQARIVARVDELMAKIDEYEKLENELVELKKNFPGDMKAAVLQAAMQGKLTDRVISDSVVNIKSSFTEEPPFDIPDSWGWFNLRDLVWNRKQKTPDKLFSYIDIGSIDNINQKLNDSENLIEPNQAPSRARKVVEYGDIIYSTVRPYLHNMAIIDRKFSHEPIASTGFAAMVCNKGVLNKYLFLYLKSPEFDKYANDTSNAKGVAYPAINDKKLYAAAIPLPPIEEQKRIVEKLDKILPLCEELEKEIA